MSISKITPKQVVTFFRSTLLASGVAGTIGLCSVAAILGVYALALPASTPPVQHAATQIPEFDLESWRYMNSREYTTDASSGWWVSYYSHGEGSRKECAGIYLHVPLPSSGPQTVAWTNQEMPLFRVFSQIQGSPLMLVAVKDARGNLTVIDAPLAIAVECSLVPPRSK
jgi:hypothetical protein